MKRPSNFVMAGGGTGGHVIPALAVARELRARGHAVRFIGTRGGIEAKLVPAAGFPIDWIEIGGLNRVGLRKMAVSLAELPVSIWEAHRDCSIARETLSPRSFPWADTSPVPSCWPRFGSACRWS